MNKRATDRDFAARAAAAFERLAERAKNQRSEFENHAGCESMTSLLDESARLLEMLEATIRHSPRHSAGDRPS